MERKVGTISRGIRCPIIREGDDLARIVVESVTAAAKAEAFPCGTGTLFRSRNRSSPARRVITLQPLTSHPT